MEAIEILLDTEKVNIEHKDENEKTGYEYL